MEIWNSTKCRDLFIRLCIIIRSGDVNMDFGSRIAKLRRKSKMTQQDLAEHLFVTDKTVSSWEQNRTEPNLDLIVRLSEVLDCSVDYLLYGNINRSNVEIEIKIKLSEMEFQALEAQMQKEAVFLKRSRQVDTYYQPIHRKFLDGDVICEWLRIGERGNKKILNYKNWYDNKYCDEYEVEIDNAKNLDKIFQILGLEQIALVDKVRSTYFYLDKYEVALDYVEKLGYFVEIEVKQRDHSAMNEYDLLLKTAKNLHLNLQHIDKRGYPYYFISGNDHFIESNTD